MSKWVKIAATAIAIGAVSILAYAVLTPETQTDTTDHMGMGNHTTYSTVDVGIIAFSIAAIVVALMVMLLWKEYEPLPPSMAPQPRVHEPETVVAQEALPEPPSDVERPPQVSEDEIAGRNFLVLRLLTGDERAMFKAIMDSGGEALQKDLILRTKMSNAKVSRLLDRLAQKGVVTKERYGSTNKVIIKQEQ